METPAAGGWPVKSASLLPGSESVALQAVVLGMAPGASKANVRMRASRIPGLSLICLGKRPSWLALSGFWGSPSLWEWHCLGRHRGQCFPKASSPWRVFLMPWHLHAVLPHTGPSLASQLAHSPHGAIFKKHTHKNLCSETGRKSFNSEHKAAPAVTTLLLR